MHLDGVGSPMSETAFQLVQRMFEARNDNHDVDTGYQRHVEGFFVPDSSGVEARLVEVSPLWPPGICWSHYMQGTKIGEFRFILMLMHPDETPKFLNEFPRWADDKWVPISRKETPKTAWDHLLTDDP